MNFEGFNDQQIEAVKATEGPICVIAGAGSGKTRVLTHRLAYLIEKGVSPYNILAVTFTNKAADEMKTRVEKIVGELARRTWVSTFHSTGARILREHITLLGYSKNFMIIDDDDTLKIIKEVMTSLNLDIKIYVPKTFRNYISSMKNLENTTFDGELQETLEKVYKAYDERLKGDNLVDFDDLLKLPYELLQQNPDLLLYYQDRFRYIMVDEFQDTNKIQYLLIKLLGLRYKNVFIVGDQDQSIYSFRGAVVENIDYFIKDFPDVKKIILNKNYRSTDKILTCANSVIKNNQNRIPKELITNIKNGEKVIYNRLSSSYEEVSFVLSEIDRLIRKGYHYEDIAIFYRANSMSRNFEEAMIKYDIPYCIYGGLPFYSRREIKDMVAYLRLMFDINDNWAVRRVINLPKRGIGKTTLESLEMYAKGHDMKIMEAFEFADIRKTAYDKILEFKNLILEMQKDFRNTDPANIVNFLLLHSKYTEVLNEDEDKEDRLDNIKELNSIIAAGFENYEGTPEEKIIKVLEDVALRVETDGRKLNPNSVKLMTYHQAKGLEFKVVFMVAMEQGIFPLTSAFLDSRELEEERRVCYVGMTRAKELLYLSSTEVRRIYGETKRMGVSLFIKEVDTSILNMLGSAYATVKREKSIENTNKILEAINSSNTTFNTGDKVNHSSFGNGVVISVDGEQMTVAFEFGVGIKKLLSKHPAIKKI